MICIEYAQGFSYVGKRPNNEDYIEPVKCSSADRIYVVCDGMGGHGHGEVASKVVACGFYDRLQLTPVELINEDYLQRVLQQVQEDLNEAEIVDEERKMGTTIVVMVIKADSVLVGHIGDSRLYQLRGRKCIFRTFDHSVVEEGIQANLLTEEQARSHPKKGQLTQCIQPHPQQPAYLTIDTLHDLQTDDVLLCVTDGVVDVMTTSELERLNVSLNDGPFITQLCAQSEAVGNDNYSGFYLRLSNERISPQPKPLIDDEKKEDVSTKVQVKEQVKENDRYADIFDKVIEMLHRPYLVALLVILLSFLIGIYVGRSYKGTSKVSVGKTIMPTEEIQASTTEEHVPDGGEQLHPKENMIHNETITNNEQQ